MTDTQHVVMFSGGISSWGTAKRVAARYGTEHLTLLFADTKMEDEDLYRFLDEAAADVFGSAPPRLIKLADGRTPWEVFFDKQMLGNGVRALCSMELKQKVLDNWMREHCDKATTIAYVGIDWTEQHRYVRLARRRGEQGWRYEAPLCDPPYITKDTLFRLLADAGIKRPRLYDMGFSHNNCAGFCVRAGAGHFINLLRLMPERYRFHEDLEEEFREQVRAGATILTMTEDGKRTPMTLRELRLAVEAGPTDQFKYDIGGCGCFVDDAAE